MPSIKRAYKTELDPNNKQRTLLIRCAGTARFVFNWALSDRIERHKNGFTSNKYEQKRRFNGLKGQLFPWIYTVLQNRHLSKAISDASFSELRRQLEYKCRWHGIKLLVADRFYPSSKTCSECGNVKPLLKLSERTYVCESCGAVMERDLNAAVNLASLAT